MEFFNKRPFAMISALMCLMLFLIGAHGLVNGVEKSDSLVIFAFIAMAITGVLSYFANDCN